jgi:hypothetical protein
MSALYDFVYAALWATPVVGGAVLAGAHELKIVVSDAVQKSKRPEWFAQYMVHLLVGFAMALVGFAYATTLGWRAADDLRVYRTPFLWMQFSNGLVTHLVAPMLFYIARSPRWALAATVLGAAAAVTSGALAIKMHLDSPTNYVIELPILFWVFGGLFYAYYIAGYVVTVMRTPAFKRV